MPPQLSPPSSRGSPFLPTSTSASQSNPYPSRRISRLNVRSLLAMLLDRANLLYEQFRSLPRQQRRFIYLLIAIKILLLSIVFVVGPSTIFDLTANVALWISSQRLLGVLLMVASITVVSFPPMIGYGTLITLCGLGWGVQAPPNAWHGELKGNVWQAWLLASISCLIGSSASFCVLRYILTTIKDGKTLTTTRHNRNRSSDDATSSSSTTHARHWASFLTSVYTDPKFIALSEAIRRKGLGMIIMIRFCPFPFCYSNLFFASLTSDAVSFRNFFIATLTITPKLFLHVSIGTKLFQLMDEESRKTLDLPTQIFNGLYIIAGSLVGVAAGYAVYNETQKVLRDIENEDQNGVNTVDMTDQTTSSNHRPSHHTNTTPSTNNNNNDQTSPFIVDFDMDDHDHDHESKENNFDDDDDGPSQHQASHPLLS